MHIARSKKCVVFIALLTLVLSITARVNAAAEDSPKAYDLIIKNGRVIDPETGRDEIATVAIKNGTIEKIDASANFKENEGERIIDAKGRIVSPGFINTHTHEAIVEDAKENVNLVSMFIVQDGVTFWLGGNCGMSPTGINVPLGDGNAVTLGNPDKPLSMFLDEAQNAAFYNNYATLTGNITLRSNMGLKHMENENDDQIERMKEILAKDLAAGSFGVSFGVMYDMGATKKAMIELAKVSKAAGGMAASHTRYPTFNMKHLGINFDVILLKRSIFEAIDTCRIAQVPFIVSHITDMAQADSSRWVFKFLDRAIRQQGLPLAGDIIGHNFLNNDFYILTFKGKIPIGALMILGNYTIEQFYAGQDVIIDGEIYAKKYDQLSLTQAEYLRKNISKIDKSKESRTGLLLICDIIPPEDTKLGLQYPWVFIGNDYGGHSTDPETGEPRAGSPRALATFSRLLGHWSRDEGAISLKQALFKATIAPALWLGLEKKGRLQERCDADIVIFNPDTVIDHAEWLDDKQNLKPDGIDYVIVNGEIVVEKGNLTGNTPGRLIRRNWQIPGNTKKLLALYEQRFDQN